MAPGQSGLSRPAPWSRTGTITICDQCCATATSYRRRPTQDDDDLLGGEPKADAPDEGRIPEDGNPSWGA
jgi:hypothetical protein